MNYLTIFFVLSASLFANELDLWSKDVDRDMIEAPRVETYPETLLENEALISEGSSYLDKHYTLKDSYKLSLQFDTTAKVQQADGHQQFTVISSWKFDDWWLSFMASQVNTEFQNISDNKTVRVDSGTTDEENFVRPDGTSQTVMMYGLGLGYRFGAPFDNWRRFDVFQIVDVFLAYTELDETFRGVDYTGPGLRTDYTLAWRTGKFFQYGLKLGHNLAYVKRTEVSDAEDSDSRSLMLSWFTVGIDLSMYF